MNVVPLEQRKVQTKTLKNYKLELFVERALCKFVFNKNENELTCSKKPAIRFYQGGFIAFPVMKFKLLFSILIFIQIFLFRD